MNVTIKRYFDVVSEVYNRAFGRWREMRKKIRESVHENTNFTSSSEKFSGTQFMKLAIEVKDGSPEKPAGNSSVKKHKNMKNGIEEALEQLENSEEEEGNI